MKECSLIHSDDLVNIAIQNNIEYDIHKYTDMNHTQILYFYTEEYSEILTDFTKGHSVVKSSDMY